MQSVTMADTPSAREPRAPRDGSLPPSRPLMGLGSGALRDLGSQRPSRARLLAALPRLNAQATAVRNRVYATAPVVLVDQRILIWQDCPTVHAFGEVACRLGTWPVAVAADNLARVEPRLEGFDTSLPDEACGVLVENALSPVLTLIERLLGNSITFEAFRRGPSLSSLGHEVSVGFIVFEPDMQPLMRGWVRADAEVWQQMDFSRVLTLPGRRVREVPVRLSLQIGRSRLKLRDLRALGSGDALRLTPRIPRNATSLKVILTAPGTHLSIHAGVAGDALTLERIVNTTAELQNADSDFAGNNESTADDDLVDDIECDVTFELGSLRLKVADISRLRAGQTLRLGVRLQEQPVRVMVNGRWIARGELAAVGDELVVVVTDTSRLPQI
jgi:type III secretion system YscQ/HrcQ family protein